MHLGGQFGGVVCAWLAWWAAGQWVTHQLGNVVCEHKHSPAPLPHAADEVETIIARGNAAVAAMGNTQDSGAPGWHGWQQHGLVG